MNPYREAAYVARSVERGVCSWCDAEITYPVDNPCCPVCGAQISASRARALLAPPAVAPAGPRIHLVAVLACLIGAVLALVIAAHALAMWLPRSAS